MGVQGKEHVSNAALLAFLRTRNGVAAGRTCMPRGQRACGAERGLGGRRRGHGWESHVHFPTLQPAALRAIVLDHAHANWGATYLGNLGKAPCGSEVDPAKGLKVETSTKSAQRPNSDRIGGIDFPRSHFAPGSRICDTHM